MIGVIVGNRSPAFQKKCSVAITEQHIADWRLIRFVRADSPPGARDLAGQAYNEVLQITQQYS